MGLDDRGEYLLDHCRFLLATRGCDLDGGTDPIAYHHNRWL